MIEQGEGAIVNIGSGSGWGKPNMLAYSASKGGIFALSAAMAYDHMRHGIRVNTVVPGGGGFVTGMSLERRNGNIKNILDNGINNADNRLTEPSDVANAVLFLLSDKATAISGTIIDVGCFAGQGGPLNNFKASQHE
jgi:NAD(P)-dependent dehydrogenase (short-subunit alcohol dehydrogenase family)